MDERKLYEEFAHADTVRKLVKGLEKGTATAAEQQRAARELRRLLELSLQVVSASDFEQEEAIEELEGFLR